MPEGRVASTTREGSGRRATEILFTDLDGTLLDHDTYDWAPAQPALARLAERGAIVALASSKTRAEIEAWRARLALEGPFISENGGGLFVPTSLLSAPLEGSERVGPYWRLALGTSYEELRRALPDLSAAIGVRFAGFGDWTTQQIAAATGLSAADAALAAQREWDEPFVTERPLTAAETFALEAQSAHRGLHVTRGGRFHHLIGLISKGRAARELIRGLERSGGTVVTVGAGDGANDLELLQFVDQAIVVARPDGSHDPELRAALPSAYFTRNPGPRGFAEGIERWEQDGG